jgi:parallel beta-helix repeat protein
VPSKLQPSATLGKRALMAVVVIFVLAGPEIIGGSPAFASHVTCGATITVDTTLDSDLVNCPNNGIVIGADNITLNLNGHTVAGNGEPVEPCPENEFCDVGLLNDGHDGITVRNGSVREFSLGVFVLRARHNRVLGVSSSRNVFFGFVVVESARSLVRDSSGSRNLAPDGDGLGLFGSHGVRIVDNSFRHNPLGIHVEDSTNNVIRGNLISRNSGQGIKVEADRNQVRRNRCRQNDGECIIVHGNRNVIARNRARRDGAGIGIEKGRGNVVARNVVRRARFQGIYLGIQNPPVGGGDNVVRRNRVRGSGDDGVAVREKDDHSLLRRNIAAGSGDDGFDVASHSSKLTSNRAVRNADLGIEAVLGVINGGGNVARHNGDPGQCSHISCG